MTSFINQYPNSTFGDILTTTNNGQGLTTTLEPLQDALGNNSPVTIATNAINFNRTGGNTFQLDGVALTAPANNINLICGSGTASGIFVATGTLSSAQLLSMHTASVTALNSPGAGKSIAVVGISLNYIYGGIAYANGGGGIQLVYQPGNISAFNPITNNDIAGLTQNSFIAFDSQNLTTWINSTSAINSSVGFYTGTQNYTAGNGSLNYVIYYSVMTVS